jgi:hypothetical protein
MPALFLDPRHLPDHARHRRSVGTFWNNSRQVEFKASTPEGGSEPLGRVEGRSASVVCASALPSS